MSPQGPGQAKWAAKLAAQLRELQEEHDEALRQRDGLRLDLERGRDELAEQRHALRKLQLELQREKERAQKLDAELQSEQREGRAHRRERLRRQGSLPSLRAVSLTDKVSDSAAIEALGGILQRSMRDLPAERRQNFKRQLLLCFHPDRNPATEVATRVTQILTDAR
uniref:J domain-containing protein n=1 Tax=Alexandrium catenella TaxID=2925 RepID=A0A7S1R7C2_ALECA